MSQPISIKNLSVQYPAIKALSGVSFDVRAEEFVAVVGRSGSGKTTLLHALAGLVSASGELVVPSHLGVVFQDHAVFPWLTVAENVGFGLNGMDAGKKKEMVEEHLRVAGLEDKKDAYPAELSGGQVQRVALARSLAHDPDILLMDEPYASLDAYTRGKMQEWFLKIWSARRKTVVFVTHDIEEAVFLSDSVIVMNKGAIVERVPVPFPRPRNKEIKFAPTFTDIKKRISNLIDTD